jgi:hypothetical protein
MASLTTFNLPPDSTWGTSLIETFMGWTSTPTVPPLSPPSSNSRGKFRDVVIGEDELSICLESLSVTQRHPYTPLELPSPLTTPVTPMDSLSGRPALMPTHSPSTTPLQPGLQTTGRNNLSPVSPATQETHTIPGLQTPQRPNRRRLRPHRHLIHRPWNRQEVVDPPPVYSAIDPLHAPRPLPSWTRPERVTWRDGFRLRFHRADRVVPRKSRGNGTWCRDFQRGEEENEFVDVRTSVREVRGPVERGLDRVERGVRDVPRKALRTYNRWQILRAKGKLQWLRRNGFLSDQERMLTRELRG